MVREDGDSRGISSLYQFWHVIYCIIQTELSKATSKYLASLSNLAGQHTNISLACKPLLSSDERSSVHVHGHCLYRSPSNARIQCMTPKNHDGPCHKQWYSSFLSSTLQNQKGSIIVCAISQAIVYGCGCSSSSHTLSRFSRTGVKWLGDSVQYQIGRGNTTHNKFFRLRDRNHCGI